MGAEDNDKQFGDVLASRLRREMPHPAIPEGCPDAELLSAYHDRGLNAVEMNRWKEHIVACERCRQILAAIVTSKAVARDTEAVYREKVAAAGQTENHAARARRSGSRLWRWAAPAAAVATGILVWFAVRPEHKLAQPAARVAERVEDARRQAPASHDEIAAGKPAAPAAEPPALSASNQPPAYTDAGRQHAPLRQFSAQDRLKTKSGDAGGAEGHALDEKLNAPKGVAGGVIGGLEETHRTAAQTVEVQAQGEAAAKNDVKTAPESAASEKRADRQKPGDLGARTETALTYAEKRAPAKEQKQVFRDRAAAAPVAPAQPPVSAMLGAPEESVGLRRGGVTRIAAPGGKTIWTIGANGKIFRSSDGGATWQNVSSGVTAELTAGSAPSDKVCWVAGRAGTVLLTTDGEHWTKLSAPTTEDLDGIFATDAFHARVRTANHLHSYATRDGGKTWTLVPE